MLVPKFTNLGVFFQTSHVLGNLKKGVILGGWGNLKLGRMIRMRYKAPFSFDYVYPVHINNSEKYLKLYLILNMYSQEEDSFLKGDDPKIVSVFQNKGYFLGLESQHICEKRGIFPSKNQ